MKTYDPRKYTAVFAGVNLNRGLADGTWIKVTPAAPRFSSKVGVDGEVSRSRRHDSRRMVEFSTMQTSEVNDRLSAILAADVAAEAGEGVGSFLLQDRNGTTVVEGVAYIVQEPDLELGVEAGTRTWKLEIVDGDATHGSNADSSAAV